MWTNHAIIVSCMDEYITTETHVMPMLHLAFIDNALYLE